MSRNLTFAVLAVLAQGCQQPEQGLGNLPQASAEGVQQPVPERGQPASETRLSLWGVGAPPRQGAVGGAAARLDGVLSRMGGCLVVTPGNGRPVQPVFPAGKARWDEASQTLSFGGRTYRPGDRITLGGGGIASPSAYARETSAEIAPCGVSDLWVVVA